jgi:hypothetical protein
MVLARYTQAAGITVSISPHKLGATVRDGTSPRRAPAAAMSVRMPPITRDARRPDDEANTLGG